MTAHGPDKLVFNFAASPIGGGYKRLFEYARYFNEAGGATFFIHPRCEDLQASFPRNRFHVVRQSRHERLVNDVGYLRAIDDSGMPDLYYAYGIPMYRRVARVNWFHLTNALTMTTRGIPLDFGFRLKVQLLGWKIRRNLRNADVASGESLYSLGLLRPLGIPRLVMSENGSDDELAELKSPAPAGRDNVAVVVGTYRYKALDDSYRVYRMLRERNPGLGLVVIGDADCVPSELRRDPAVQLRGLRPRPEVIARLRAARFYISTTYIENSFNAASEGAFLADESYVSDIPPHRELLESVAYEILPIPGSGRRVLRVKRGEARHANIRSWQEIITDMVKTFEETLAQRVRSGEVPA